MGWHFNHGISENEDLVNWATGNFDFDLMDQHLVDGTVSKSDSMYYAILKKRST